MENLETEFASKQAEYERLIAEHTPDVDKVKRINGELINILDNMLKELAKVQEGAGHIEEYRDKLVAKLASIQRDYNGLLADKDQVATLKALRGYEDVKFNTAFFWYAIALCIATALFFFALLWKGGYKAPAMPTMMSNPMTTEPLM
jgi:hypothetical protein